MDWQTKRPLIVRALKDVGLECWDANTRATDYWRYHDTSRPVEEIVNYLLSL